MGDKAILVEVLQAADLTEAYADLTPHTLINELRHVGQDLAVQYSSIDDRTTLGNSADERRDSESLVTFTVDEAVEALGFGRFQVKLSILTGLAWLMLLSLLSPSLVCEWGISPVEQALVTTCVFSGMMLSSTFWGKLCDRFGRTVGLRSCAAMAFAVGILSAFSPTFYFLLFFRGLTGFGIGGVPQSVTLYAEFLPVTSRAKCVVMIEAFWAVGAAFEALLAYFVAPYGWRVLVLLSACPLGIFSLFALWLPESARFHVATGQVDKAMATLQRAARENRVQLPKGTLVGVRNIQPGEALSSSSLMSTEYRRTTLLLWFIWAANAFSYYGSVLFTTVLFQSHDECHGGFSSNATMATGCQPLTRDDYFHLLSATMAEFPGLIVTVFIIEWLGRKKTMCLEFGIFAVSTYLLFFCLNRTAVTSLIFLSRAFISGAFQCAYVYTPEVYPTTLRAAGLGAASAMARLGAIVTPFVAQVLSGESLSLPIGVYGTAALLGAIASISLPIETKGRKMTDTV